jgi:hypothetical protein
VEDGEGNNDDAILESNPHLLFINGSSNPMKSGAEREREMWALPEVPNPRVGLTSQSLSWEDPL